MTVRIVTLFRGWQWIAWSCGACAAVKKRQGWSVDLGKVVEQGCDFCSQPVNYNLETAGHQSNKGS